MVVKGIFIAAVVGAAKLGNASVNGKIYCVIPDVMHLCNVPTTEFQETFNASMRYVFLVNKCLKNAFSLIKFDLNLKKFQNFYL
jgi:hypothetical protein